MSCITGEEGNGGDDPDLEERIIKQLNEENHNLKSELAQYKKQGQDTTGISIEMTSILRDRINDLLVENADLEKEVARLRYSHTAMVEADASKKGLKETERKLKEAKKTLNDITNENQQLKIAIGKARYGTPLLVSPRKQDLENINILRTENQDLKAQVGKIRYAKPINIKTKNSETENVTKGTIITIDQPFVNIDHNNHDTELLESTSNEQPFLSFDFLDENIKGNLADDFENLDYDNVDSLEDEAYVDDDIIEEHSGDENQEDECPKQFGDYFKDFRTTMKSSSKRLWDEARKGKFDGKEVAKIFGSIKDTSKSVLSDMWNSGHDWSKTAKDIGKNVDEKLENVLKQIPEIPQKIGPATKKVVKATKNVIKKLETSVRKNMNNAKEFLKEQLDEDPAVWTKKKAKKIEEGLKNFLQNWDLDNVFFDQEQQEDKNDQERFKNGKRNHNENEKKKQKEFKKKNDNKYRNKKQDKKKYDAKYKHDIEYKKKKIDTDEMEIASENDKRNIQVSADETEVNQSPEIVPISQNPKKQNEKKDYRSWSAVKISVNIEDDDENQKRISSGHDGN
jgi:hypothetical protein